MGLERRLRVIGDSQVLETEVLGRLSHLAQRTTTVARGGVIVKRTAEVLNLYQLRELMRFRCGKFTVVFTKLRLDVIQIQRTIKFGLIANLRDRLRLDLSLLNRSESVFVERPAARQG